MTTSLTMTTSDRRAAVRCLEWTTLLLLWASLATPAIATEQAAPARFAVQAEVRTLAVSSCGRFAMDAKARYAPEAKSADGRYTLKAVNAPTASCDALSDLIFANGFQP